MQLSNKHVSLFAYFIPLMFLFYIKESFPILHILNELSLQLGYY